MAVRLIRYRQYDAIAHQVGLNAAIDSAQRMTRITRTQSNLTVPVDSGELRASQVSNVSRGTSEATGTIKYRADHAMAIHEGARPHIITPRNPGGKLVFRVGGRRIVTDRVNHPGNAANPWLYRALVRAGAVTDYRVRRKPASIL